MTTVTKDRYQIRDEARIEFDNANPQPEQPKYSLKDAEHDPSVISRHSEGRIWLELGNAQHVSTSTDIYLYITIGDSVHRLTVKASELDKLNLSIFGIKTKAEWVDDEKATYSQAYKAWQEAVNAHGQRRNAFVEEFENKWRASLSAEPADSRGDFDDDDDFDPDEDDDDSDDDE